MKTNEKYQELLSVAKAHNTSKKSVDYLLSYYQNSLGWNKLEAINYTMKLFNDGTIEEIKVLGRSDEENDNKRN